MNLNEKPSWLELPEEEKLKHTYWRCSGTSHADIVPENTVWSNIFHSKEDAEAHACIKRDAWTWDRKDATPTTLKEVMSHARKLGRLGVRIKGWKDGAWKILKEYPSHIPLLDLEN